MKTYNITVKWLKNGRNGQATITLEANPDDDLAKLALDKINENRRKPIYESERWETDIRISR